MRSEVLTVKKMKSLEGTKQFYAKFREDDPNGISKTGRRFPLREYLIKKIPKSEKYSIIFADLSKDEYEIEVEFEEDIEFVPVKGKKELLVKMFDKSR